MKGLNRECWNLWTTLVCRFAGDIRQCRDPQAQLTYLQRAVDAGHRNVMVAKRGVSIRAVDQFVTEILFTTRVTPGVCRATSAADRFIRP
jgi:hypothetical protein